MSHSAESLKESPMLGTFFSFLLKLKGASIKNNLEKSRIVPKKAGLKNSDSIEKVIRYVLREPNIRQKMRIFNTHSFAKHQKK